MNNEEIKARLLYKLVRYKKWGASHTSFDNLHKGFKPHLAKQVNKTGKELIRKGLILQKPTSYGLEVSLNPRRKEEILRIIGRFFKIE